MEDKKQLKMLWNRKALELMRVKVKFWESKYCSQKQLFTYNLWQINNITKTNKVATQTFDEYQTPLTSWINVTKTNDKREHSEVAEIIYPLWKINKKTKWPFPCQILAKNEMSSLLFSWDIIIFSIAGFKIIDTSSCHKCVFALRFSFCDNGTLAS